MDALLHFGDVLVYIFDIDFFLESLFVVAVFALLVQNGTVAVVHISAPVKIVDVNRQINRREVPRRALFFGRLAGLGLHLKHAERVNHLGVSHLVDIEDVVVVVV